MRTILIQKLRESTKLTEGQCSDKKLLEITEGTLIRTLIEIDIAKNDLLKEIKRTPKKPLLIDIIFIALLLISCIIFVLNIN